MQPSYWIVACLLSCLFSPFLSEATSQQSEPKRSLQATRPTSNVIIIGAGIAGLGAARTLLDSSPQFKVTVLEGNTMPGGRVRTVQSKQGPLELGATWVHGYSATNPIYALCQSLGLTVKETVAGDNTYYFDPKGKILNPDGDEYAPGASIYSQFYDYFQNLITATDKRSVGDMFRLFVQKKKLNTNLQNTLLKAINNEVENEYAESAKSLSARYFDMDEKFPKNDALLPGGMIGLINGLIRPPLATAAAVNVIYNQIVTSIDFSSSSGLVSVKTKDGSLYQAPYVISTLPLGVMQKNVVQFNPSLPSTMMSALYQRNMGDLERIVMVFPSSFWDPEGDLKPGWLNPAFVSPSSLWMEWYSLSATLGKSILIGFNAGDIARRTSLMDDASLLASGLSVLKTMFPSATIPQPTEYFVSRWLNNPFSYGAYSSPRTNASAASVEDDVIAQPLGSATTGRLLFAGEHTLAKYFATLHGALISGQREANRIISYSKSG